MPNGCGSDLPRRMYPNAVKPIGMRFAWNRRGHCGASTSTIRICRRRSDETRGQSISVKAAIWDRKQLRESTRWVTLTNESCRSDLPAEKRLTSAQNYTETSERWEP